MPHLHRIEHTVFLPMHFYNITESASSDHTFNLVNKQQQRKLLCIILLTCYLLNDYLTSLTNKLHKHSYHTACQWPNTHTNSTTTFTVCLSAPVF